ncbi:UNVERIFIED_ORG: type I restriction enzyme S subunit [Arthrobacter sp. UYEF13]
MTTAQVELSELMVSKAGSVDPKKCGDEKFELFSIPAFDRGFSDLVLGSEIGSTKQLVRPGDVMLSKIVPHIRRAWIVPPSGDRRQIASGEWILFRSPRIHGPYLRHLLTSDFFNRQFMQTVAGVGGSLLRARPAHVAKLHIPLPALDEQRRLAAILDKADELRIKRRRALAHLDAFKRSLFDTVFGDPIRNERNWPSRRVSEFISNAIGGKNIVGAVDIPGGHRVLKISALTSLRFDPSETKPLPAGYFPPDNHIVRPGDLLFSRANTSDLVGATVLVGNVPGNLALPDKIWRLVRDPGLPTEPRYVESLFQHRSFRSQISSLASGSSGSMKNISKPKLFGVAIGLPPAELQRVFADRVDTVERISDDARRQLAELDALFASLQHRAFSPGFSSGLG